MLGVCQEIRHAYLGELKTHKNIGGIPYYAFCILWPEAAFVAAVLENFVLLSRAKMLYVSRLHEEIRKQSQPVLLNQIALIHYFQDLV